MGIHVAWYEVSLNSIPGSNMVVFPNIEEIRAPGCAINEWPGPAEALELMGNLVSSALFYGSCSIREGVADPFILWLFRRPRC